MLQTIEKLHRIRTNGPIASWSFYTQAFNTISIDAYVSKELNIPYCLKTKNVSKQTSSNNTHFAIAMEYRASPNGMTPSDLKYLRMRYPYRNTSCNLSSTCLFLPRRGANWYELFRFWFSFTNTIPTHKSGCCYYNVLRMYRSALCLYNLCIFQLMRYKDGLKSIVNHYYTLLTFVFPYWKIQITHVRVSELMLK